MLKKFWRIRSLLIAKLSHFIMKGVIRTCHITVDGVEEFIELAGKEKCILMLWHNRLAIVPFVLKKFTPHFLYAALVSGSRDGEILSSIVHSYKNGRTIKVPHHGRYQALREVIRHVEEKEQIVVITPDGPRGPRYEIKPGIAVAALETQANMIALDWEANRFWELNTWDRLRVPKPFAKISVKFHTPVKITDPSGMCLEGVKKLLKERLNT